MTPTREEVERLVSEVTAAFPNNDYGGSDEALRMGAVPVDASACMETAAMLRALLARAEAAEAERNQWIANSRENKLIAESNLRERDAALAECERLRLGGCARGQTTTQWCAEAVQMMTERDAARAEAQRLQEAALDALAHLTAAVSLLEKGGKKAAASDKMFAQMLIDYNAAIKRTRAALATEARDE